MASPVLLILGAGPNIGKHVANAFTSKGYKVALASRKNHDTEEHNNNNNNNNLNQIHVPVDLTKPETVPGAFDTVKAQLGAPPSVVVYNGALRIPNDAKDPLTSFSLPDHDDSMSVNSTSVLLALQQAIAGFRGLPATASKTFIFTGNILNLVPVPGMLSFGMTKGATAYAIRYLVETKTYEGEGVTYVFCLLFHSITNSTLLLSVVFPSISVTFLLELLRRRQERMTTSYQDEANDGPRFYYADERTSSGSPVFMDIDGPAAAIAYLKLAEQKEQGPWLYTFVKGEGYKDFGDKPWAPAAK